MTFEADLKTRLQGGSGIAVVVGDRITPLVRKPGGALPAITYQVVAGLPQQCLDGFTSALSQVRVQVDCWSGDADEAYALGALVQAAMLAEAVTGGIRRAVLNLYQDFYEDAPRTHRRLLDFSVWYRS